MDNQNNPNSQNNPTSSSPAPSWPPVSQPPAANSNPQPPDQNINPVTNPWMSPAPAPLAPNPIPTPIQSGPPTPAPVWPPTPEPVPAPITPAPTPAAPAADMWSTLPPQDPTPNQTPAWIPGTATPPASEPAFQSTDPLAPSSIPAWSPPPEPTNIQPEPTSPPPIPTFEPTAIPVSPMAGLASPLSSPTPTNLSPLDNPWGAPAQPPAIDGSAEQQQPQNNTEPTQPSWNTNQESTPTDLSHLISNGSSQTSNQTAPETLVAPSSDPVPEVPTLPTETHQGIPVWLIGVGAGLLILVIGASAYFILGIGQPAKTTSLPVATTPGTTQVTPPQPIATPFTQPTPVATGSANFGELQGSGAEQQATSSAMDTVRQRNQQ